MAMSYNHVPTSLYIVATTKISEPNMYPPGHRK